MPSWLSASASVIGTGHSASGVPCQDSHCCIQRGDDKWLAMVISDGAGTAKYSDMGANLVAKSFAHSLIALSHRIDHREPGAWINDFVIGRILKTRDELRSLAKSESLKEYHCTLVACLLGEAGGFIIHIGDGAAFGGAAKAIDSTKCSLSDHLFSSPPENGEYSNETFFITEGDWIKHLRITPISNADWIVLGTDGGTALAMVADRDPKPGFVVPLITSLAYEKDLDARNAKLAEILADAQADRLTSDDKTICLAFRKSLGELNTQFVMPLPTITQAQNKGPIEKNSIGKSTQQNITSLQNKLKRKILWKVQVTRKVMIITIGLISAISVATWVFMNYENADVRQIHKGDGK